MPNRKPSIPGTNQFAAAPVTCTSPRPQKCIGLIGQSLTALRIPAVYIAEGRELGLDLHVDRIDPTAMKRARPGLSEILNTIELAGFAGAMVCAPYKEAALTHVDNLSDTARHVGAVTTIAFRDGKRFGYNSLSWALIETMQRHLHGRDPGRVLILGARATGSAVAYALAQLGVHDLHVYDPNPTLATDLAERFGAHVVTDLTQASAHVDGIVNATRFGREDQPGVPLPLDLLAPHHWVADLIDSPCETAFVQAAQDLGCRVISGSQTAAHRAAHDFQLMIGLRPDPTRMRAAVEHFCSVDRFSPMVVT